MRPRFLSAVVLALTALLFSASRSAAASFPPELRFRSIVGRRVTLHYHQGLEAIARHAAALAEELLARHEARYQVRVGRVHVVLADVEDDPNGFASPIPYPLVHLRAVAPSGTDELGNYEDWMRILLAHELAHVVHLEQARGLWRAGRTVFGRVPLLFPNAFTPTWLLEGLATFEETEATAFGRGGDPDVRMVLRMAAVEGRLPREDVPVVGLDRWPGGLGAYFFGEAFVRDLTQRFGPDTLPRIARVHAGRVLPYLDEVTVRKVTGAGLTQRWNEWRHSLGAELRAEAQRIEARGLTPSRALTSVGVRQVRPRFSPDGQWIAYTSRRLTRLREIRLMRKDGSGDRHLAWRNGGSAISWTPDGSAIVFDEPERHRLFATRSDLRRVELRGGRVRRLTRGLRAREPDLSPDGRLIVFVRQAAERSELALVSADGRAERDLTRSAPGVQWGGPRFCPDGSCVVASRWSPGGWLDIVLVDATTGAVEELTHDRAKDVEPAWMPDGTHVLFRSDRDGVSNLYALRMSDRALLRVSNVLGGAFTPEVAPHGAQVAFAAYTARGYDVHVAPLALDALPAAEAFVDPHPEPHPLPEPAGAAERPYRPLPTLRPRFWSPYLADSGQDTRIGAVTGGADPLLRHAWALQASWDTGTRRPSAQVIYQYDRFRPTLVVAAEERQERVVFESGPARLRDRELVVRASLPLVRRLRHSQTLSLSWRRERESVESGPEAGTLDLGGLEAAWTLSTLRQYPYSISPMDGVRLRLAALKEDPVLGSDVALAKLLADGRAFLRLGETHVLAARVGGGTTLGRAQFQRSFAVGGFPDASLLDLVRTNQTVLRGYPDNAFTGRRFLHANLEYRFPLAQPQRGWRSFPLFVRHLHAALFADAAQAWSGAFRLDRMKTSAGAALGADVHIGHGLPLTATVGIARGFAEMRQTRAYFRLGLAF